MCLAVRGLHVARVKALGGEDQDRVLRRGLHQAHVLTPARVRLAAAARSSSTASQGWTFSDRGADTINSLRHHNVRGADFERDQFSDLSLHVAELIADHEKADLLLVGDFNVDPTRRSDPLLRQARHP